ncbi:hypothetical protein JCM12298_30560 [Desulfothermus naphthae]
MVQMVIEVESVETVGIIFRRPHDKNCHFLYLIVIIDFLDFKIKKSLRFNYFHRLYELEKT